MHPSSSSPSPTPSNNDDPRGEEFDISTLPATTGARQWIPTQWSRAWLVIAGLLAVYCLWFFAYGLGARSQNPLPLPINTPSSTAPAISTVTVHVAGAVARPGVYSVSSSARIADAIAQAGGVTPDAETTNINLADFVRDGTQIVVPVRTIPDSTPLNSAPVSIVPSDSTPVPSTSTDTAPSKGLPATTATTASDAAKEAQLAYLRAHPIDLNRASSFELQQLPGIGPSRADEIIAYRTQNGLFRSVSDLDNVKGIGEKRMEVLKDLVVVR